MRTSSKSLLASGARTTTQTLGPYANPDNEGDIETIEIVLSLTAFSTAASLTLSIEEANPTTGTFEQVIAATALTATGVKRLRIGTHTPNTANENQCGIVGNLYRVVVTHGNANSHTYSVSQKAWRAN